MLFARNKPERIRCISSRCNASSTWRCGRYTHTNNNLQTTSRVSARDGRKIKTGASRAVSKGVGAAVALKHTTDLRGMKRKVWQNHEIGVMPESLHNVHSPLCVKQQTLVLWLRPGQRMSPPPLLQPSWEELEQLSWKAQLGKFSQALALSLSRYCISLNSRIHRCPVYKEELVPTHAVQQDKKTLCLTRIQEEKKDEDRNFFNRKWIKCIWSELNMSLSKQQRMKRSRCSSNASLENVRLISFLLISLYPAYI